MPLLHTLLEWLRGPGWRGHLLALAAGALTTLSFTPFDIWPLGLVSIALLYQGLACLGGRQAMYRGWFWGLGLFLSGVSWIYISIHVHGYASPPLAGLLTGGLVAGLALIPALTAWIWVRWLRPDGSPLLGSLGFAALWVGQEFFRSWFLTGFPWLYQGYAHTDTWLAGWAPLGGVWLLSFICVLSGCLLSEWSLWRRPRPAMAAGGLLLGWWIGGALLTQVEWTRPAGEPLSVALIQADIEQSRKWDPAHIDYTLATYRDMTYAQRPDTDIIVWPETAVPVLSSGAMPFVQGVAANLAQQGTTLITGIPIDQTDAEGQMRIYNGIMVAGEQPHHYLKHKLVPFGEYVPLEGLLRGMIAFFDLPMSSFSRGPVEQAPLEASDYRLAPFICYETVYPDFAARLAARSELLITISNDSWFGESIGPLQHLQMARMRALESGRWMIRGTNNGVTALIDHQGRITARIPQFQQLALHGEVQPRSGLTPWLRWGNWPLVTLMLLSLLACAGKRRNSRR
ncbi:apolipoprotein N-acyltransferase [Halopseudomonas pertucinogena]|uniref:Apolipoprotein N-acyltransferase n=1 Tax=Halopseudomonas pertucinogena TaxID=86175 RepID=A0ABQ2CPB1_9GAMM|nr:apolipoprotein N-acyltransferase [Halopseudomonas pertucinogena]GGI99112.1 apolipoprotein N-acyltransferase [Halopseudomonas pertucinogena]